MGGKEGEIRVSRGRYALQALLRKDIELQCKRTLFRERARSTAKPYSR